MADQFRVHPIPSWSNVKLKFKQNNYPVPGDPNTPRPYFCCLAVGARGSGKTFCIAKLLKQYENFGVYSVAKDAKKREVGQRIVLMSPTHDANRVWSSLKHLAEEDVHTKYSDGKLLEIVEDVKQQRHETAEYQRLSKLYKKFLRSRHPEEDLSPEEIRDLEAMGFVEPKKPRYPHGCVTFLILDDLVGSSAFKSQGRSALTELVLKNRHLGVCIIIATQSLRSIPKAIRTNANLYLIWRFASKKIIMDDLYTEVSSHLTLPQFESLIDFATREEHSCLVIDFSMPKAQRYKKNFEEIISFA